MSRRAAVVLALGVLLGACGGVGTGSGTQGFVSSDGLITTVEPDDRRPAPALEGEDLDGEQLSSADFEGKVIVVNLWGSWCPPCRAEAPALAELAREYEGQVQFLGILTRDNPSAARAFNRTYGIEYPTFVNQGSRIELGFIESLPPQAIPTTWVIDARGRVAARILDEASASILGGLIDDVLAEAS